MRSVKARDYMRGKLVTFTPDMDYFNAIETLLKFKISSAPVLDDIGHVVGQLTDANCLKSIMAGSYYDEVGGRVRDYMNTDFKSISPNADVVDVVDLLVEMGRAALPVVEDGMLVGQLSCSDVLKAVYEFDVHAPEH